MKKSQFEIHASSKYFPINSGKYTRTNTLMWKIFGMCVRALVAIFPSKWRNKRCALFFIHIYIFIGRREKKKKGRNDINIYEKFRKNRFIILTRVKDDGQRCEHPYWNEFIISCMILNEIYCNCHAIKQTGLNDSKQTNEKELWIKHKRTEFFFYIHKTPTEKNNA